MSRLFHFQFVTFSVFFANFVVLSNLSSFPHKMDADWYSVNGDDEWFNEDNSFPSLEIVVDTNNNNNHTLNWEDFFEDNKIIQFTNLPPSDCKHADRKQKSHAFNRQDQQSTVSFSGRMKVGYFPNAVIDLANQVKAYGNSQYSFVVCPIVDPNNSIFEPICDLHLTSQGRLQMNMFILFLIY